MLAAHRGMCQAFIVEISLRANISLESVSELVENCILRYKNVVIDCVLKMKLENSIIDGMAAHKSFLLLLLYRVNELRIGL